MTILSASDSSDILTAPAWLVDEDYDTASTWASKYIKTSPYLKWIVGNYVEADSANRNNQYWTLDDLKLSHVSVHNAPMSLAHGTHPIGTYVASELIFPIDAAQHPFVESLSTMWKYRYPDQFKLVEESFRNGTLYQSMECVADSITCVGTDVACNETFEYKGPFSDTYCEHIKSRAAYRQFNNTSFTGGALIIPPDRPGWKGADIKEVASLINSDVADDIYGQVAAESPSLNSSQWESLMQMIVLHGASKAVDQTTSSTAGRLIGIQMSAMFYS
jgi:hypothetical protein